MRLADCLVPMMVKNLVQGLVPERAMKKAGCLVLVMELYLAPSWAVNWDLHLVNYWVPEKAMSLANCLAQKKELNLVDCLALLMVKCLDKCLEKNWVPMMAT